MNSHGRHQTFLVKIYEYYIKHSEKAKAMKEQLNGEIQSNFGELEKRKADLQQEIKKVEAYKEKMNKKYERLKAKYLEETSKIEKYNPRQLVLPDELPKVYFQPK